MKIVQIVAVVAFVVVVVWTLFGDQLWRFRQKLRDARALKKIDPREQAVIVRLRGSGLPAKVYEQYDLSTLQDQLRGVIDAKKLGEFDGNEFGPEETTLYMYGPDAERLFSGVESVLRGYPLCKEGVAIIRSGPLGAPQREVKLS